ncbi:MAG: Efflux ABC transporter, permease protein [Candidatus Uhrbacteria bacterium GW2011_GWA2_53_10]|uniref:Cell division protein FtsX n=1 Tax=Candidatus Uhrbacteria bacterium GW2011_GWA2_53_10 TaxID=1618980 RepID=A0A0G1ZXQ5_9BACT|nr:MAG: Efflux ABC transporter, permease protein [Candidatus Uhrbacteria bacterium GW2011_GWA2_53_10]
MLTSTYRVLKFAGQNIWRNFWLSLITVSMLVLTLFSINLLLILNLVTDRATEFIEQRIEVSVYFKAGTPQARATGAAGYLRGLSQVRDVEVVTPEEALQRFRVRHATDEAILRSLEEIGRNPFGPALIVRARTAADFSFVLDALDNPQFKNDIREKDFTNYEQIIQRIRQTTDRVRWFGLGISLIFLVIATMIIFNTVRIGIFIHREEIGIMKLVGATDWFVRMPFILEAIIYSLAATAIVAAVILPAIAGLEPKINAFFDGASVGIVEYFRKEGLLLFTIQFLALALLNIVSTRMAMRKYLRV